VDRYIAGATIAHEYAFGLHRRLVARALADDQSRELLKDSALIALELIPALARQIRGLEREWEEQELLDPAAAHRTVSRLESVVTALAPQLAELSDRHRQIVAELLDLVGGVT
jgi:hypothetical protein